MHSFPQPLPVRGIESLDFDGIVKYIKESKAKNIVVITGAGISTAAGIPDYRSSAGLYAQFRQNGILNPEKLLSIGVFREDPSIYYKIKIPFYNAARVPTKAHLFIRLLADAGILRRLYTQNVDGLDRAAGTPTELLVEAHGTTARMRCTSHKCGAVYDAEEFDAELKSGTVPKCPKCGGVIRPCVVFYGEELPKRFIDLYKEDMRHADLVIIIGSSLQVQPISLMPGLCPKDCPRVLINDEAVATYREKIMFQDGVPYDRFQKKNKNLLKYSHYLNKRDVFLQGDCQETCEKLCVALGWESKLQELIESTSKKKTE